MLFMWCGTLCQLCFSGYGGHGELHGRRPSFPTRRSSDLRMPRGVRTGCMIDASAICDCAGFVLRIAFVDDGTALRCVETDRTALRIRHVGVPAHRTERPFQTSAHAGTTLCLVEAVGLSLQIAIGQIGRAHV